MSGGGTRSGRRSKGGASTSTPAGVTYSQFMAMGEQERYDLMNHIIDDKNIKVPDYLDESIASKVMYALGINGKPEVVSEAEFRKRKGEAIYRTVRDVSPDKETVLVNGKLETRVIDNGKQLLTASDIIKQIKFSDFTRLSNHGGSFFGRALYFANNFKEAASYSGAEYTAVIMRAKIKKEAKFISVDELNSIGVKNKNFKKFFVKNDAKIKKTYEEANNEIVHVMMAGKKPSADLVKKASLNSFHEDSLALIAIAHGYDGWYDTATGYKMVINRGSLVTSVTNKHPVNSKTGKVNSTWASSEEA